MNNGVVYTEWICMITMRVAVSNSSWTAATTRTTGTVKGTTNINIERRTISLPLCWIEPTRLTRLRVTPGSRIAVGNTTCRQQKQLHRKPPRVRQQQRLHLHKTSATPSSPHYPQPVKSTSQWPQTVAKKAISSTVNYYWPSSSEFPTTCILTLLPQYKLPATIAHQGVGEGVLIVKVEDQQGVKHPVQLQATIVPGLDRY